MMFSAQPAWHDRHRHPQTEAFPDQPPRQPGLAGPAEEEPDWETMEPDADELVDGGLAGPEDDPVLDAFEDDPEVPYIPGLGAEPADDDF